MDHLSDEAKSYVDSMLCGTRPDMVILDEFSFMTVPIRREPIPVDRSNLYLRHWVKPEPTPRRQGFLHPTKGYRSPHHSERRPRRSGRR